MSQAKRVFSSEFRVEVAKRIVQGKSVLARIHPYRDEPNGKFAANRLSLKHGEMFSEPDGEPLPVAHPAHRPR